METTQPRFEALTIGGVLDRMFRIYGSHFALLLGIVAVSYVPLYAVQIILHAIGLQMGGPDGALVIAVANLVVLLLMALVAYPLTEGAATFAVSELYLGRTMTIGQAYRNARRRWGTIINAQITVGLRVFIGMLLFLVPGIIWMLMYSLTIPVVVLEGGKATDSMRRSQELTVGQRRKILNVLFLVGAITWVVGLGVGMGGAMLLPGETSLGVLLQEVLGSLVQLLVAPLGTIVPILLYYDCRIRKEGFDLEMLSQALAQQTASTSALPQPANP